MPKSSSSRSLRFATAPPEPLPAGAAAAASRFFPWVSRRNWQSGARCVKTPSESVVSLSVHLSVRYDVSMHVCHITYEHHYNMCMLVFRRESLNRPHLGSVQPRGAARHGRQRRRTTKLSVYDR